MDFSLSGTEEPRHFPALMSVPNLTSNCAQWLPAECLGFSYLQMQVHQILLFALLCFLVHVIIVIILGQPFPGTCRDSQDYLIYQLFWFGGFSLINSFMHHLKRLRTYAASIIFHEPQSCWNDDPWNILVLVLRICKYVTLHEEGFWTCDYS